MIALVSDCRIAGQTGVWRSRSKSLQSGHGWLFIFVAGVSAGNDRWHVSEAVIDPASGHSVLGLASFREQPELLFADLLKFRY